MNLTELIRSARAKRDWDPLIELAPFAKFLEIRLAWSMESAYRPKTINFTFEYLRSGRPEDTYANVFMIKQGQRVAHLRVEAWQSSPDKPIAIGHGNFMIKLFPDPAAKP